MSIENKQKFFNHEMIEEMKDVFGKMKNRLLLKLSLDNRNISSELEAYMSDMAELTDKLTLQVVSRDASSDVAPSVEVYFEDGASTGLAFYGVPAHHEFRSFLLGLYNAAGPGQELDESIRRRISSLKTPLDIKVLVTLSCPMCPDLVIAAQHIAAENSGVTAHIFDISHFEKLRNKYNVMSVPCLVINDDKVSFGRKNIKELLDFIEK